jgi:hypothetical protein
MGTEITAGEGTIVPDMKISRCRIDSEKIYF